MAEGYRTRVDCLNPVAIKCGQVEVHAPGHETWGEVECDGCGERFKVGYHRIFGSLADEERCVRQLETILKADHGAGRQHENFYYLDD